MHKREPSDSCLEPDPSAMTMSDEWTHHGLEESNMVHFSAVILCCAHICASQLLPGYPGYKTENQAA